MRVDRWVWSAGCAVVLAGCSGTTDQGPAALAAFGYDRSAPLDVQETGYTGSSTTRTSLISYISPGGGRATGALSVPLDTSHALAGIVLLGDVGVPAITVMTTQEGVELAYRGAVVIAIDPPYLRRGGALLQLLPSDSAEQVQLIRDLQRAVDVLVARSDVDPGRLGFVGLGYGATMGALLAGVETRLKAYALATPDAGWVAHFTQPGGVFAPPVDTLEAGRRAAWLAAMTPVEPLLFIHRAPPAALLIQSAQADQQVDYDDAVALHDAAANPRTIVWYPGPHTLPAQAKTERQAFFAARLGTMP